MNSNNAADLSRETQREFTNLDLCYGEIGISAVAAAIRFQNVPRRPAGYIPVTPNDYD